MDIGNFRNLLRDFGRFRQSHHESMDEKVKPQSTV